VTTDFVYLRLIGDRSINEKNFGKINKDRTKEMEIWSKILEDDDRKVKDLNMAIITANNPLCWIWSYDDKVICRNDEIKKSYTTISYFRL